jgi:DNA recombination protein RmuC
MSFTPELALLLGIIGGLAAGFLIAKKFYGNVHSDRDQLLADKIRLEAEKNALSDSIERSRQDVVEMEKKFTLQFENLANRIFDEKTSAFKKQSQENLGTLLNPLKEKLQEFQKKVDDSFGQQAKEQYSLKNEIKNIIAVNEKMSVQTESLTKALKGDVKAQGNWGEVMLEKILEESGLRRNQDYILQGTDLGLKDAEGRQQKPDVIVKLPDAKHIIVDAKVSLTHYERYCGATEEAPRAVALKEFLNSLRAHVTGLEQRRYQDTDKLGAPDFVLMFLPIEGAYSLAVQEDTGLHAFAWEKRIIIVTPTTLFTTLRTVASLWRIEMQNRNTAEIARQGGMLYDKVAGFVKDMEDLGKKLSQASDTYDKAFKNLTTGPGNIVKKTEDLKALGVKTTKSLPKTGDEDGDDSSVTPLKQAENG